MLRATFNRELQALRDNVLRIGSMADTAVGQAMQALKSRDQALARQVVAQDAKIDTQSAKLERDCITLIIRHQPMARDLRFIIATLNIVQDLERIGDHAANISSSLLQLGRAGVTSPQTGRYTVPLLDIPHMAHLSREMLRASLDAFIEEDARIALTTTKIDDKVDQLYQQNFRELVALIAKDQDMAPQAMHLIFCSHNIERIADRATNICERVIFVSTGQMEEVPLRPELVPQTG